MTLFETERDYFFYKRCLLDAEVLWFYLMAYFGSLARHKQHGMQRIDYSILLEYDGKPLKFAKHQFYMYLRRLFTVLLLLTPCYTGPILALLYVSDGEYKYRAYMHLL